MTIYDIAKMTGVSPSTVSRVINGKPGVGAQTRARIKEVLKQNNYIPDETARSLATQATHMIGILTDNLDSYRQNEGTAKSENELMANGYQCYTKYIGGGADALEEGIADLAKRHVEGVLLMGPSFMEHSVLKRIIKNWLPDTPVILVHQTERIGLDNVYCVGANEKKGFRCCVERMVKKGRRNLILVIDKNRVSQTKIEGYFRDAVSEYTDVEAYVYTGVEPTVDGGIEIAGQILNEHPEVDGVLCAQDGIAIGVMYAMQDQGRRIAEDISVIGEDNSTLCDVCRPRLTSLDTMLTATTLMSVHILLDVLRGREQTRKVTLDMELVERETL